MNCPNCNAQLSSSSKFCPECGTRLAAAIGTSTAPSSAYAERRQLTMLFCDVVASTALSAMMDPEDLRDIMRQYQSICGKVIQRFEGHISKYLGDGLLVEFGYPTANEDDAQRAVRAGLGMLEALRYSTFKTSSGQQITIDVRIGVHTGVVLIDEVGAPLERTTDILGETPGVAAQLQEAADPNSLVISGTTEKLVAGFFEVVRTGRVLDATAPHPVEIYTVLHESAARSRFEASRVGGMMELIGRSREMAVLDEAWTNTQAGHGRIIFVSGEAGIGKSRLTLAIKEQVANQPNAWLIEIQCSPYHQNTAYYPIADLFERTILRFDSNDNDATRLAKLEGYLAQNGLDLEEHVPLMQPLLSLPQDPRYRSPDPLSKTTKQRTVELLLKLLLQRASAQPVLFVAEDLHWADPSTVELLGTVIECIPDSHILAVLTYRPEFYAPWVSTDGLLLLGRLPQEEAKAMVEHLVRQKRLPIEIAEQILAKTDGVPLFVEELTRTILESGSLVEKEDRFELVGTLANVSVPTTLKDSLMARLDRLASSKRVAQVASVLGREFNYPLLEAIYPGDKDSLQTELTHLVASGLVFQNGHSHDAIFTFKHALVQDAAYDSLLKSERQEYHLATAIALRDRFHEIYVAQPGLVAQHFTASGHFAEAVPEWLRAGHQADARSANKEAGIHYLKGIELVEMLPSDAPVQGYELPLQLSYGMSQIMLRGYSVPEVAVAISRARELCPNAADTPELPMVLWLHHVYNFVRGDLNVSVTIAEEFLDVARRRKDSALLVEANSMFVLERLLAGDFLSARKECEECLTRYSVEEHGKLAYRFTQDPLVVSTVLGSWGECIMGYADRARALCRITLEHARSLGHTFSLNYAIAFSGWLYYFMDMPDETERHASEALQIAQANGYYNWMGDALILLGWVRHKKGDSAAGIFLIEQGMTIFAAIGRLSGQPGILDLKIEVLLSLGRLAEARDALDVRWALEARTNQQYEHSVAMRLEAELLLAQAQGSELGNEQRESAEDFYRKAIADAQRRSARNFELKAWLRLLDLVRGTDRETEVLRQSRECYSKFTEGWDTPLLERAAFVLR